MIKRADPKSGLMIMLLAMLGIASLTGYQLYRAVSAGEMLPFCALSKTRGATELCPALYVYPSAAFMLQVAFYIFMFGFAVLFGALLWRGYRQNNKTSSLSQENH